MMMIHDFFYQSLWQSYIYCSWKLLNLVQKVISSLQSILIIVVSLICWVCLDDALHFVYFTWQSPCSDQFRKFSVDEVHTHSKFWCHWLQTDCFVGFKELGVDDNSCLSDEVSVMGIKVRIFLNFLDDPQKHMEKLVISAVVETL